MLLFLCAPSCECCTLFLCAFLRYDCSNISAGRDGVYVDQKRTIQQHAHVHIPPKSATWILCDSARSPVIICPLLCVVPGHPCWKCSLFPQKAFWMQMEKEITKAQHKQLMNVLDGKDGMAIWRLLGQLGLTPGMFAVSEPVINMHSVCLPMHWGGTLLSYFRY